MAAVALDRVGLDLFGAESASAQAARTPFATFDAIAASADDVFEVPAGFRADVLIGWDDAFQAGGGEELRYGFNNDFLAYFPLRGQPRGAHLREPRVPRPLLPPRLQGGHGPGEDGGADRHRAAVGGQLDRPRGARRAGPVPGDPALALQPAHHGGLAGDPLLRPAARRPRPSGESANGSLANCSGGTTPWGTALSCEENYQDYGAISASGGYGWGGEYDPAAPGEVRLGRRARPLRPRGAGRQAHRARALPAREHGVPPGGRQALRGLHGRRPQQRRRVQVRLRARLRERHAAGNRQILQAGTLYVGALGARGPAPLRHARRHRAAIGELGHGLVGEGRDGGAARHGRAAARALRHRRVGGALRHQPPRGPRGEPQRHGLHRPHEQLDGERRPRLDPRACARTAPTPRRRPSRGSTTRPVGRAAARTPGSRASRPPTTSSSTARATCGWSPTSRRARSTRTPSTATTRTTRSS